MQFISISFEAYAYNKAKLWIAINNNWTVE